MKTHLYTQVFFDDRIQLLDVSDEGAFVAPCEEFPEEFTQACVELGKLYVCKSTHYTYELYDLEMCHVQSIDKMTGWITGEAANLLNYKTQAQMPITLPNGERMSVSKLMRAIHRADMEGLTNTLLELMIE